MDSRVRISAEKEDQLHSWIFYELLAPSFPEEGHTVLHCSAYRHIPPSPDSGPGQTVPGSRVHSDQNPDIEHVPLLLHPARTGLGLHQGRPLLRPHEDRDVPGGEPGEVRHVGRALVQPGLEYEVEEESENHGDHNYLGKSCGELLPLHFDPHLIHQSYLGHCLLDKLQPITAPGNQLQLPVQLGHVNDGPLFSPLPVSVSRYMTGPPIQTSAAALSDFPSFLRYPLLMVTSSTH